MSNIVTPTGEKTSFDGPQLSIITPVYVTNPEAAKRLANRMDGYAEYIKMFEGAVEWIILIEESHPNFEIRSKGLTDPMIRAIHTRTKISHSQSRLRNLGLEVARGKFICMMDQDFSIPPMTLGEIMRTPLEPGKVGMFRYEQGGMMRPDVCQSCMVYHAMEGDMYFDERFVGQTGGEMLYFIDFYELEPFGFNCPAYKIVDNYHDVRTYEEDMNSFLEYLCMDYKAPLVTDFSMLFKKGSEKLCLI